MVSIDVDNISVRYPVYISGQQRSVLSVMRKRREQDVVEVPALNNVSFTIREGERVGLIGHNGAGKSTLLKVLGGMVKPAQGKVKIKGRPLTVLNIGAGFEPDKSGYENIRFVASLMGLSRKEAEALVEDVEDFSDLGEFLALPIRSYSAGMAMRLAFGVYTGLPYEILVIDEVIGAGDAKFQSKASARIQRTIERASIMVIATHSPDILNMYCTRGIWMAGGELVCDGDPMECWRLYAN